MAIKPILAKWFISISPEKRHKTFGFVVLGSIEMKHWAKID